MVATWLEWFEGAGLDYEPIVRDVFRCYLFRCYLAPAASGTRAPVHYHIRQR
jgi:hypothetical protein